MATKSMASEDLLKQGQQLWEMLDEMSATSPESYQAFIQKHLAEGARMFKPPQPAIVLHCKIVEIPKPKSDQDPIPVRGGTLRKRTIQTSDGSFVASKQGQIFDLAFNPDVLEECLKDAETEEMLIQLSMDYIEKQVGLHLVRKMCVKLKEKCIGTKQELHCSLNEQYKHLLVRTEEPEVRLPTISKEHPQKPSSHEGTEGVADALYNVKLADEWVGSGGKDRTIAPQAAAASKQSGLIQEVGGEGEVVPRYCVRTEGEGEDEEGSRVCVEVDLPGVKKVTEVDLDLSENVLELSVSGRYAVNITLPREVKEEGIKATFNPKTHVLCVVLPIL